MAVLELGFMRHDVQNKAKGQELVDWAMSHNVNHFEACWFYMQRQCEPYLYSLLEKYNREDYYICGKLPIHNVLNPQLTHQQLFEEQLRRVPDHYFDTYLLQALDERVMYYIQEHKIIEYFLDQKKKGTIKRFGLSIQCLPGTFKKYLDMNCWDVVQMPINYYDWFLCRYDENYKLACEYGLPIIAQAPIKGGLLVKPEKILPDAFDISLMQAAYTFINQLDNIEMILCGNSSLYTFEKTYEAANNLDIPPISLETYKNAIDYYVQHNQINCIRCGNCIKKCPRNIPVSAIFTLYNLGLTNKSYFNALDVLISSQGHPSHTCIGCGTCTSHCPQKIDALTEFKYKIFELRT